MARAAKRISNNKRRKVEALLANAEQAVLAGRRDICEAMCREIERLWPDNPDLFNLRGIMAARDGQPEEAVEWFHKAVEAAPRRFEFHKNHAAILASLDRPEEAARAYRAALALNERSAEALLGLAKVLMDVHDYAGAREALLRGKRYHPTHLHVLLSLSKACLGLGLDDDASDWVEEALKHHPDATTALMQKANIQRNLGDLSGSETLLRRVLDQEPGHVLAACMLSQIRRFEDVNDPDIALLRRLHANATEGSKERKDLCFALGKALEDIGDYDAAFACFEEGNRIRRREVDYDANEELTHLELITQHYTPEVLARTSGLGDETPIFIVGMPRCGSTLVEQILAAHPDVASRGEWGSMEAVLFRMQPSDSPLTLEQITAFESEQWREVGERYLEALKTGYADARHITDKNLVNIRLIGAIHCALPRAKIIHVRRHPLDACWSLFKADFASSDFQYIYSMGEIGYYYRAYLRLMAHWREVLPQDAMLDLDYEELVIDQEEQTRRLLAFCGLPWNDACLRFQEARTVVRTSSAAQVRRELYRDALQRWKHYERHLEPLIKILGAEDWPD